MDLAKKRMYQSYSMLTDKWGKRMEELIEQGLTYKDPELANAIKILSAINEEFDWMQER